MTTNDKKSYLHGSEKCKIGSGGGIQIFRAVVTSDDDAEKETKTRIGMAKRAFYKKKVNGRKFEY